MLSTLLDRLLLFEAVIGQSVTLLGLLLYLFLLNLSLLLLYSVDLLRYLVSPDGQVLGLHVSVVEVVVPRHAKLILVLIVSHDLGEQGLI